MGDNKTTTMMLSKQLVVTDMVIIKIICYEMVSLGGNPFPDY